MSWQTQPSSARPRSAWHASSSRTSRRVDRGGDHRRRDRRGRAGVFTTLAEASTSVKDWLQWSDAVGPLSGKVIMVVLVWLVSWAILHVVLRSRPFETRRALVISLILIGLGVIGTFPTFFQLFGE